MYPNSFSPGYSFAEKCRFAEAEKTSNDRRDRRIAERKERESSDELIKAKELISKLQLQNANLKIAINKVIALLSSF